MPDGRMISLPIPHASGTLPFKALRNRGLDIGQLASDLTGRPGMATEPAHLDPDLDPTARRRRHGWRPSFGQDGAAQRHLDRMGIGVGDLFLFFGWFREVVESAGRYRYKAAAPNRHVLFGWLRVEEVLRVGPDPIPSWLRGHPHARRDRVPHNTIYLADGPKGAGIFPTFQPELQLTEPDCARRSQWRLPADFLPGTRVPLTYHGDPERWTATADGCRLRSVAKGQEFVLDLEQYPGVRAWAEGLVGAMSSDELEALATG